MRSNGAARASGYDYEPIIRMSNTYMKPGDYSFEELLEDIKDGVYIRSYQEWNIDDIRWNQRYVGVEAYRIVDGELREPVREPVLELTTKSFFSSIDRAGVRIGWEPRHESWWADREFLTSLMDELDLTHIVDPTVGEPLDSGPVAYFRLHGRWEGRRIVYNHQYSEDELSKVLEAVRRELERRERVYVMFNNGRFMFEDALRFLSMLLSQSK